jgi:hypothetical protein
MAVYNLTCQHCESPIMNFGGVHFTEVGAVCQQSPDTQHRPPGVPVPPRKAAPTTPAPAVPDALKGVVAEPRPRPSTPPPASVVARGADTDAYHGAGGSKAYRRGRRP